MNADLESSWFSSALIGVYRRLKSSFGCSLRLAANSGAILYVLIEPGEFLPQNVFDGFLASGALLALHAKGNLRVS
jgi:hypothetical protein